MSELISEIPAHARALTALGNETLNAVAELYKRDQGTLFQPEEGPAVLALADALREQQWCDAESARLIRAYGAALTGGRKVDIATVARWVLAHDADADAATIAECMNLEPPPEVDVLRVLSKRGSQKIVFLGVWRLRQNEVVLKRIIGAPDHVDRILERELQPHPLGMVHPNIIETHILRNSRNEAFLAEKRLRTVLSDDWRASGLDESANLLYEIGRALTFLHDHHLVHGDIKPDNIGQESDRFVLLDFGICRPAGEFTPESTPTGSLRTRAPEFLVGAEGIDPYKLDVWALGATVFNAVVHRFPLFREGEKVPRVSSPADRTECEKELAKRVQEEWDRWVVLDRVDEPLRSILQQMLARNPKERPTANAILASIQGEMSALLRSSESSPFSAHEDYLQIKSYLNNVDLTLIPVPRRQQIVGRLRELARMPGFTSGEARAIEELEGRLVA